MLVEHRYNLTTRIIPIIPMRLSIDVLPCIFHYSTLQVAIESRSVVIIIEEYKAIWGIVQWNSVASYSIPRPTHSRRCHGQRTPCWWYCIYLMAQQMSDHYTYMSKWTARQFPVRPAFTTTVNKLQSESFSQVVIWLYEPVCSYVQI